MKNDDSFKKPGSIPFKWEIRPGVPKPQTQPGRRQLESGSEKLHQRKHKVALASIHNDPIQETPRKLKPPPAGLFFHPPMEPQTRTRTRTRSIRSSPRTLSDRVGSPRALLLARPDVVITAGCFPSPQKPKNVKGARSVSEPDYYSDIEVSSRWSVSSRKTVPTSSPSIHGSSPRPVSDAEWAGFGLF
ncbi:uncharacterized protein LOC125185679 [Salvia hispanica]|uniref:uncharacterized protein LOC125185679 n=1 Tax=Salvia hispanica TaxID=49212 RepID=UPI002009C519|nr:uncharacterized protein LOC125185679 [Salvia hispanica]